MHYILQFSLQYKQALMKSILSKLTNFTTYVFQVEIISLSHSLLWEFLAVTVRDGDSSVYETVWLFQFYLIK